MKHIRFLRPIALALAISAGAGSLPAYGQAGLVPAPNPEADRLAQEMRVLAADPRDVRALLEAGNSSARLGDTAAALAFFARAEAADPTNPGILAGRGAALVRMERPGEALRLFQAAEARGLPVREYAGDRGFAYDLLGQPGLAQADYKLALQNGSDDETIRRYALSLGISGNVDESMRQLDPLLRKSDRAAWRARAFVLAMNGDMPGAERIAASMMPGNMGHSLAPFFRRLANLAPADRAFAVHFGQLSPTAARLADARQAPPLPRYIAPTRAVQVAQAQPQTARAAASAQRDRRSRREREREARDVAPPARRTSPEQNAPVQTAAAAPLPVPPSLPREQTPLVQPLPAPRAEEIDAPVRDAAAPTEVARRETPRPERAAIAAPGQGSPAAASAGDTARADATPAVAPSPVVRAPAPANVAAAPAPGAVETLPDAARPTQQGASPTSENAVANRSEPTPPGPARVGQEDSVLASIVAGITIPAEELQVVTAVPVDPVPEPTQVAAAPEAARPTSRAETARPIAPKPKPKPELPKAEPAKGKDAKKVDTPKPDPKAKKGEPAKPDPKAKKPEPKGEPARVWVQVAGGANVTNLPQAWKSVTAKAPAAFKGKSGWWTPLRATNRVLAGPFKSAAEAQAFVNSLRKADVPAFVFTSEAGQKVTRLGGN
ncbi:SPOR domain-containing protein [Sphingomonas psychrotolerans]|uniref:SPOR domain-containing protein n=1 Tax=Sphingomonas psychrotolerans TaxID=1327635 RepID=A0ABU3N246_9SPHN|nr:SPOR domain-containing protein [Sphingomonas psychrotolerans]MDT8757295.1 SPOR domain-containing protein [Sphingomonas psychrotolerans]